MLTTEDIAQFLNDFPETNRLTHRPEFSAERVKRAIEFIVSEWNETPPLICGYTPENFPYKTTLLYGVVSHLFSGEATLQSRNHLPYNAGGLSVDDSNRAGEYMQFANFFGSKFKDLMERQKRAENVLKGWHIIPSGHYRS